MRAEHRRRQRVRRIRDDRHAPDPFGDVLPDRTRDEQAEERGDAAADQDDRLRREVPPHYG